MVPSTSEHFSLVSGGECCPTGIRLFRGTNNTLRVRWRSSSPLTNYTAEVSGSQNTHTCSPLPGSNTCDVSEIVCGQVYSVVVAPLNQDGTKVQFCSRRMYSGNVYECISTFFECISHFIKKDLYICIRQNYILYINNINK